MSKPGLLAFLIFSLALTGSASAASFGPYRIHPVASWPEGWPDVVAIGDFDGDARKDVCLATTMTQQGENPDDFTLFLFLQRADGTLASPVKLPYSTVADEGNTDIGFRTYTGMTAADLNGDGIDDIVVGRRFGITIAWGSRSRNFATSKVANTTDAGSADAILTFDVDRDGYTDVVIHNETSGDPRYGISVYFGDASGSFRRQRFQATRSQGGIEMKRGDVNFDGRDDVVISWYQGHGRGLEVFTGTPEGWFNSGVYIAQPADLISVDMLVVGDFDRDLDDDLLVGGPSDDFDGRGLFLYRNEPPRGFLPPARAPSATPRDSSSNPDTGVVADVNGDGLDDIVMIRNGGVLGYLEQGIGGLKQEVLFEGPYATWTSRHGLAVGDINGDGCPDAVTANYNYGLVVFPGQGCVRRTLVRATGSHPLPPPGRALGTASPASQSPTEFARSGVTHSHSLLGDAARARAETENTVAILPAVEARPRGFQAFRQWVARWQIRRWWNSLLEQDSSAARSH